MMFYDRKGNRLTARGMLNEPKYLSMKREKLKITKRINNELVTFYQKLDNQYMHFNFRGEWFKGQVDLFERVEEMFDADHLLKL